MLGIKVVSLETAQILFILISSIRWKSELILIFQTHKVVKLELSTVILQHEIWTCGLLACVPLEIRTILPQSKSLERSRYSDSLGMEFRVI
jgi:hypothetical protein